MTPPGPVISRRTKNHQWGFPPEDGPSPAASLPTGSRPSASIITQQHPQRVDRAGCCRLLNHRFALFGGHHAGALAPIANITTMTVRKRPFLNWSFCTPVVPRVRTRFWKKIEGAKDIVGDLSSIAETKSVAEQVNKFGGFDAVIHNAEIGTENRSG